MEQKTLWSAFKSTLIELLDSKKFVLTMVTFFLTFVVALLKYFAIIDTTMSIAMLSVLGIQGGSYVFGQGAVDVAEKLSNGKNNNKQVIQE